MMNKISVAEATLNGNEKKYVLDCLDSTWISSSGKYITEFEAAFAKYCGVKHAISTNNGTTALHLALVGLDLKPGDEVIVPTVTYIATANAVRYCGATPVLVDCVPGTLNICPDSVEKAITSKTKGIIPVHLYGHPANVPAINQIAAKHGLWVLEDAAEAHGSEVNGVRVGALSDCATFSFFGNKIITTGEGGMITTNNDQLAEKMKLYRSQGMDPNRRYWFPVVGYNYRMTNIQAAIGLAQLENIEEAIAKRDEIKARYKENLARLSSDILFADETPGYRSVCWMFNIFLSKGFAYERDRVRDALETAGIETRPVFHPMHTLPPYKEERTFKVADEWCQRGINLPTHLMLTEQQIDFVCKTLVEATRDI